MNAIARSHRWSTLGMPLWLFYLVAFLIPQAIFLGDSLYQPDGPATLGDGPTLANFVKILTSPYYLEAFRQSLLISAAVAAIGLVFALPLAFYISHGPRRRSFLVLLLMVSMLFSNAVIRTLGWRVLLSNVGPVNMLLLRLHLVSEPVQLLDNYTGVLIGVVHALLPIYVMSLIPVTQSVPRNLLMASAGLSASRWRTFWFVVFPIIRGGVLASALLIFANSIGAFTTPAMLGGGRTLLLPILIRERVLLQLNWPIGAALAATLTALIIGIYVLVALLGKTRLTTIAR
jgi:putative spermidine/putrescine transport system permease protein